MKRLLRTISILALAAIAAVAQATTVTSTPPADPHPPVSITSNPTAGAGAESNASAAIGNVTGGQGGIGGASSSNSTAGDSSSTANSGPSYSAAGAQAGSVTDASSSKYLSLSMPQPVWSAVPAAFGCIVSESKSGAFGWNFVSASGTRQVSDAVCTTVRMSEAATLHCHFASAAHLNKRAFEQMYPGSSGDFFLAGDPQNLSLSACEDLKRPKLRMDPVVHTAPAAPVACTPPTKYAYKPMAPRKVKKTACVNCCQTARI